MHFQVHSGIRLRAPVHRIASLQFLSLKQGNVCLFRAVSTGKWSSAVSCPTACARCPALKRALVTNTLACTIKCDAAEPSLNYGRMFWLYALDFQARCRCISEVVTDKQAPWETVEPHKWYGSSAHPNPVHRYPVKGRHWLWGL